MRLMHHWWLYLLLLLQINIDQVTSIGLDTCLYIRIHSVYIVDMQIFLWLNSLRIFVV